VRDAVEVMVGEEPEIVIGALGGVGEAVIFDRRIRDLFDGRLRERIQMRCEESVKTRARLGSLPRKTICSIAGSVR
jgi:hypothetical protein